MSKELERERMHAVQRYQRGENPHAICTSLGQSRFWLYKWIKRYSAANSTWCCEQSRQPHGKPRCIPAEIEEIITLVRVKLDNEGTFRGDQAILWELVDLGVKPLPSLRTINGARGAT